MAVALDFSRFMHNFLHVDPESKTALAEPGIVLDRVREAAERLSLTFAPDPATHSRCTIGGMIGNNSCGTHSLLGDKTVDNIKSLDILLYDVTRMTVGPVGEESLDARIATGGRAGVLYADLKQLRDKYASLIRERFPRIPRRISGYNLDELVPGCCGMAGPFGFEKKKYDISQRLAERVLLLAVRHADRDTVVVVGGFSCHEQIAQNSERQALHLAEVLAGEDFDWRSQHGRRAERSID